MTKKIHLFSLALAFSALSGLFLTPTAQARGNAPAPKVTTVKVQHEVIEQQLTSIGTLAANQSVNITPEINGRVIKLNLSEGGQVKEGESLVLLDDREQSAKVRAARVSLKDKKRQLAYMQTLYKRKAISEDELKAQEAEVESQAASLAAERAILDHYSIEAPFSGVLGFHDVSRGTLISAATVITTLDDLSTMKLTFELPENTLSQIQKGATITAVTDAWSGEAFTGSIETISPRIDTINLTFQVRATLDNPELKLRPGMLMRVSINQPSDRLMTVPARSVLFSGNDRFVYVVDEDNIAHKRSITTGQTLQDKISVQDGLEPGETIIDQGVIKVSDGRKVSPQDKKVVKSDTRRKSSEERS